MLARVATAARASGSRASGSLARGLATVAEQRIKVTFIMAKAKQKVTVPAMVGWNLLEAAQHHGLLMHCEEGETAWDYTTFGEGPAAAEDHVIVANDYYPKMNPMGWQEKQIIRNEIDDITPTSRLATCIKLTREMDGLSVIFPDTNPDLTNYC